ncbi:type III-B CRISPR module-associated protein Cmr3 [Bacillus sp. HMF5848]|uniref:type III-B CRISPR module-associated protein Cmr3 n=1 Tax=Bacillus sp. HMF5848 TaxID=2495421 RepID=UPI0016395938|nr:type III-B CRISPR module-associated protein Cmr3 [Bacillus sp. HMF5848]
MTTLFLKPVDTFFFRDHKELTPGENSSANGYFPPRPGTVYGAIRSAYIHYYSDFVSFNEKKDGNLKEWMGTPSNHGGFSIKGTFLHDGEHCLLPLPIDHQVINGKEKREAYPLHLVKEETYSSDNSSYRLYGVRDEKSSSGEGLYIPLDEFKQQLLNRDSSVSPVGLDHLLVKEPKVGIARNWETRRSNDGMLYQMIMSRFVEKHAGSSGGLLVECDNSPDLSDISIVSLGGENRPWTVEVLDSKPFFSDMEKKAIVEEIKSTEIARMILVSPAIWEHGNLPNCWNPETNKLHLADELSVDLLTIAVSRPMTIGGWDIKKQRPKKRKHAVSAGTVLYVRVQKEQAEQFVNTVFSMRLTDDLAHEGYGYTVCGSYKMKEECI